MSDKTGIGWTDATWNAFTGCAKVSEGCDNCYAETFAERWRGTPGNAYEQGFDLRLWPERLDQPIKWTKPRMIFVNSMSDMFYSQVPREFVAEMFAVMWLTRHHTYQILTKRPKLMKRMLTDPSFWELVYEAANRRARSAGLPFDLTKPGVMTLPNVWLGVSIESREHVGRADLLRDTPAAVRFISAEPLLGPLLPDASYYIDAEHEEYPLGNAPVHAWRPWADGYEGPGLYLDRIDWLIIGGESGPGARPMQEEWARELITYARFEPWESGALEDDGHTRVFMKQMGAVWARAHGLKGKADDPVDWPVEFRHQEYPGRPPTEFDTTETSPRLF